MTSSSRVALVTGANSGIGLASALELAACGHQVVGTVRSEEKAEVLRAAAGERKVQIEVAILDVTDADGCAEVVDRIRPDAVVNNAGYGLSAPMEHVDDGEARALLETMLIAPMRIARLALPHMAERGWGRVVNISSILGRVTMPLTGWYQAAKHGLEAASDALRMEVAGRGVKVVLVEPGFFRTAIFDELERDAERYGGGPYDDAYQRTLSTLRRAEPFLGDPRRVGEVVARAVGATAPRARYVVGYDAMLLDVGRAWWPDRIRDRITRAAVGL